MPQLFLWTGKFETTAFTSRTAAILKLIGSKTTSAHKSNGGTAMLMHEMTFHFYVLQNMCFIFQKFGLLNREISFGASWFSNNYSCRCLIEIYSFRAIHNHNSAWEVRTKKGTGMNLKACHWMVGRGLVGDKGDSTTLFKTWGTDVCKQTRQSAGTSVVRFPFRDVRKNTVIGL
jgi:hypothetical protein